MNSILWIVQIVVASLLITSGILIILIPKRILASKLSWVNEYSNTMRYFICLSKILGGIGLVLPMYLGIWLILTPISAVGIALFMLLAMRYHLLKKEYKDLPATIVFLILAIFIAYYRF